MTHSPEVEAVLAKARKEDLYFRLGAVAIIVTSGLVLGLALPNDAKNEQPPWNTISAIIGWVYFAAWTVSFFPQIFMNHQRRSTAGLSYDYEALNIIGFCCYLAYNLAFYYNASIQRSYEEAHRGHDNNVQMNDVLFSGLAVVLTVYTIGQCVWFRKNTPNERLSKLCMLLCTIYIVLVAAYALAIGTTTSTRPFFSWLYFVYFLSGVKVSISFLKYIPQAFSNFKRKSTVGWNVFNVVLDLTGGTLSIAQLVLDSWIEGDWSGITGDAAKLGLGMVSIVFDLLFIIQHYVLYKDRHDPALIAAAHEQVNQRDEENESLLTTAV